MTLLTKPRFQDIEIEFEPRLKAWLHLQDNLCPECKEPFVIPNYAFFADCKNKEYNGPEAEPGCPISIQLSGKRAKGDQSSITNWTDGKLWVNMVSFTLRVPNRPRDYYFIVVAPSIKDFRFYSTHDKLINSETIPPISDFSHKGLMEHIKLWMTFS